MSQAVDLRTGVPARTRERQKSRLLRPLLMLGGVVVLVVGGLAWYLSGGGWVSIDDAYVQAAKLAVSTDVSGIVAQIPVHEGEVVKQGEVLFRLDDRPFRIALDGAKAELAQTALTMDAMKRDYQQLVHQADAEAAQVQSDQNNYDRYAGLVKTGAVTRAQTDDARYKLAADQQAMQALRVQAQVQLAKLGGDSNVDVTKTPAYLQAQAKVDEAQRELDHTVVHAPFGGVVTQVDSLQPGQYLAAASPGLALVSNTDVWAQGFPKETELTWVKPGDLARVSVDTYPGRVWTGHVQSVAPASGSEFSLLPAQNTSGNWVKVVQRIPLRVELDRTPDQPDLRAGMSVEIDIETGHARTLGDLL
jgi:membrane fusion protein (multidrug efflux system)